MNFNFSTYEKLIGLPEGMPAYTCVAEGEGFFFAKKGAMVAQQGQFKYEKILIDPNSNQNIVQGVLNQMARRVTGENMEIMKVSGSGRVLLANNSQNVTIIPVNPSEEIGIESENLLAFTGNLNYGVRFIGSGVISQKGLFTTNIKNNSNSIGYIAILTYGNAIVLNSPCDVDPDAIICWTGKDPGFKMDVNWKTLIGQTSGESYMLEFKNHGQVVVVQPSERKSGLNVGFDAGQRVSSQSSSLSNSMQNISQASSQATGALNGLGRILGR